MSARVRRIPDARRILSGRHGTVVVGFVLVVLAIRVSSAAPRSSEGSPDDGVLIEIERTIQGVFSEERCTTADEARNELLLRLPPSILENWTIVDGTDLRPNQCVATRVELADRRVALFPALSPVVRATMEEVTQALIERCYAKDEAVQYVMEVLTGLGEEDFEVRTDGPLTAPVEQIDDVRARVTAGCWVYSGTGWNQQGHRFYYVSGLDSP